MASKPNAPGSTPTIVAINAKIGPNGSMNGKVSIPGANPVTPLPALKKPAKPLVRKK